MKNKQITFKNPFDLIGEDEEVPMSIPTQGQGIYQPPVSNIKTPLPFNPYQISKQEQRQKKEAKPQSNKSVQFSQSNTYPIFESDKSVHPDISPSFENIPPKQYQLDQNGDPPLLNDIGIEPYKIKERIMLVLKIGQPSYQIIQDPDLSGPIVIGLALGCLLLFSGKIHFGDIYAMFILGNCLIYFLFNFMSQTQMIPLYSIMSILGYGLLPMLGLGVIEIFVSLNGGIGIVIALLTAIWSSFSAGTFMDVLIKDAKDKKILVIYPLFLFYVSFTMIVIF